MRRSNRLAFVLTTVAISSVALADPVTHTYDVRDLLIAIPDFDASAVPATQPFETDRLASLITTLRQTAPVDKELSIQPGPGNGSLIVVADKDAQAAIGDVLKTARANRGREVLVETRVVRLDEAAMEALDAGLRTTLLSTEISNGRDGATLSAEQATAMTRLLQNSKAASTLTFPRMTLFSGQRAKVMVMTQTAYVAGLDRIVGKDGAVGYDPDIENINSGVDIRVRACTDQNRQAAVSLQVKTTAIDHIDMVSVDGGSIQKPQITTQQFDSMFIAPPDTTIVLAPSKTSAPTTRPTGGQAVLDQRPSDHVGDHMYVLVKATAIIPQETGEKQ